MASLEDFFFKYRHGNPDFRRKFINGVIILTYVRGATYLKERHKFVNEMMKDHSLFEYLFNPCPKGLEGNIGKLSHDVKTYEDAS